MSHSVLGFFDFWKMIFKNIFKNISSPSPQKMHAALRAVGFALILTNMEEGFPFMPTLAVNIGFE